MPSRFITSATICLAFGLLTSGPLAAAGPGDWSEIPSTTVKLFYPGQSSYAWIVGDEHKKGNAKVKEGKSCTSCHEDEEESLGELIAAGERLEPDPIDEKPGTVELNVQAAHDSEYLYLRFQWQTASEREGRMHNMMRFDGEGWAFYGGHQWSEAVVDREEPALYEDRLAIMLDDGNVPMFKEHGCWLTCHDSMRDMPDEPDSEEVAAHAVLGAKMKKKDIRKYLALTRDGEDAAWDAVKDEAAIGKLRAEGKFLDLMQWRAHRSNPVGMADDGYVLEYRNFDAGNKMFSWNVDRETMTPKMMFDASKNGAAALTEGDFDDPEKAIALIEGENAVPYDAGAGFKEGDILPGRLLSRSAAKGSAADNDQAEGSWADSTYTVVFRRKLDTGHPEDDKVLKKGSVYSVGFAIHDDNVTGRFHHVSFTKSLGIGTDADITAVTLN